MMTMAIYFIVIIVSIARLATPVAASIASITISEAAIALPAHKTDAVFRFAICLVA
jgi:hypothetical protein